MSHTLNLEIKIACLDSLRKAIKRLGLTCKDGTHRMYDGKLIEGTAIKLDNWGVPVVVDKAGTVHYDNYGGAWGSIQELHNLTNVYALIKARAEAEALGHYCVEGIDETGSLTLTIEVQEVWNG